jgi:UDP-GlcNAc:undecaprenyl-phosphate GlcNAc-1-phosphate transferase
MMITIYTIAFVVSVPVLLPVRRAALALSLVDRPDTRKLHTGSIPLAGGIAVFLSSLLQLMVLYPSTEALTLMSLCFLLLATGVLDDLFNVRATIRLLVQLSVALCLIYWVGLRIEYLGPVLGSTPIFLSGLMVPIFTSFCIIGVANAINMIDGMDGLLGSITAITLLAMSFLASGGNHNYEMQICLVLAGSISAFLLFNIPAFGLNRPLFMGDAGSIMIGFMMAALLIALTQGEHAALDPVVAGWLVGLPLLDTASLMVRRVVSGKSPFEAGRDHLHHTLHSLGLSATATVQALVGIHLIMVSIGLFAHYSSLPNALFFWLFVATAVAHFLVTPLVVKHFHEKFSDHSLTQ